MCAALLTAIHRLRVSLVLSWLSRIETHIAVRPWSSTTGHYDGKLGICVPPDDCLVLILTDRKAQRIA